MGSDNPLPKGGRLKARSKAHLLRGCVALFAVGILLWVTADVSPEEANASLEGMNGVGMKEHDPDSAHSRRWVVRAKKMSQGAASDGGTGVVSPKERAEMDRIEAHEAISVEEVRGVEAALKTVTEADAAIAKLKAMKKDLKEPKPQGLFTLSAVDIKAGAQHNNLNLIYLLLF